MKTALGDSSPLTQARLTGLLYLTLVPLGFFSLFVSSTLLVPGDTAATSANILASESLFRLSIVTAFLLQLVNIFVVLGLYRLLSPVNRHMARLMVIFLLLAVPIAMLNELNSFGVLEVLNSNSSLSGFTTAQVQSLVPLFLNLHELGTNIAGIFWGLWLFPMGYLVYKSGFLPRILGVLLIIGGFGYLVDSAFAFLAPNLGVSIALFTFWGEVFFPLWLLVKGVNLAKWHTRALATDRLSEANA